MANQSLPHKSDFLDIPGLHVVTSYAFRQNFRHFTEEVVTTGPVLICNGDIPRAFLFNLEEGASILRSSDSPYRDANPIDPDQAAKDIAATNAHRKEIRDDDALLPASTNPLGWNQRTGPDPLKPQEPAPEPVVEQPEPEEKTQESVVENGIRFFDEGDQIAAVLDATFVSLEESPAGFGSTREEAIADLQELIEAESKADAAMAAAIAPEITADESNQGEESTPVEPDPPAPQVFCQVNVLNPAKSCTFGPDGSPAVAIKKVVVTANGNTYPECNVCQQHLDSLSERVSVEVVGEAA
jgi:hypothetical protein